MVAVTIFHIDIVAFQLLKVGSAIKIITFAITYFEGRGL